MVGTAPDITQHKFAVLDFETTGLNVERDQIVEVAVVHLDSLDAEPKLVLDTLVDPGQKMGATDIHGLGDWDVEYAPSFASIVPNLTRALEGRLLVLHNARFDLRFLRRALTRALCWTAQVPAYICTMELVRLFRARPAVSGGAQHYNLGSICQELEIEHGEPHAARGDALACAQVLRLMVRHLRSIGYQSGADWQRLANERRVQLDFLGSIANSPISARSGPDVELKPRSGVPANYEGVQKMRQYRDEIVAALIDRKVTPEERRHVSALRDQLGLSLEQIRAIHARVFAVFISRFVDPDNYLDKGEESELHDVWMGLREMGWAPGEAPSSAKTI